MKPMNFIGVHRVYIISRALSCTVQERHQELNPVNQLRGKNHEHAVSLEISGQRGGEQARTSGNMSKRALCIGNETTETIYRVTLEVVGNGSSSTLLPVLSYGVSGASNYDTVARARGNRNNIPLAF